MGVLLKITDDLVELEKKIRKKQGLIPLNKIQVSDYPKHEKWRFNVYASDDLQMIMAMYVSGAVIYAWSGNVRLSEVTEEEVRKYSLKGRYVLWSENPNHRSTEKIGSFRDDFLSGWNAYQILNGLLD